MNETGGTAKKYRHDNEQGSRSNMGKGGKNKSSYEETCSLLRDKSSQWNEIGRVLGVPFSKREEFRTDPTRNNDSRLEAVVNLWLQNGGDTSTWDQLIRKLQELGLNDIISKIKSHVKEQGSCNNMGKGGKNKSSGKNHDKEVSMTSTYLYTI